MTRPWLLFSFQNTNSILLEIDIHNVMLFLLHQKFIIFYSHKQKCSKNSRLSTFQAINGLEPYRLNDPVQTIHFRLDSPTPRPVPIQRLGPYSPPRNRLAFFKLVTSQTFFEHWSQGVIQCNMFTASYQIKVNQT